MLKRQEAIALLHEIDAHAPKPLFHQIDRAQQGMGFVLAFLVKANDKVIAGDIAKELNVSTARIAALLGKMEKQGLITRRTSSEDARRTVVEITPEGITRASEIREQILQKIELLLERVGEEDLREFIRISGKIKSALEE